MDDTKYYVERIILSCNGKDSSNITLLKSVVSYARALAESYGNMQFFKKMYRLHKHNSILVVLWGAEPTNGEKEILEKAYKSHMLIKKTKSNIYVEHRLVFPEQCDFDNMNLYYYRNYDSDIEVPPLSRYSGKMKKYSTAVFPLPDYGYGKDLTYPEFAEENENALYYLYSGIDHERDDYEHLKKYPHIVLSSYRKEGRTLRLENVFYYALELAEYYGNTHFPNKVARLHDHKGLLTVVWREMPTLKEKEYFLLAWESPIGDLSPNILHLLDLSATVRKNQTE